MPEIRASHEGEIKTLVLPVARNYPIAHTIADFVRQSENRINKLLFVHHTPDVPRIFRSFLTKQDIHLPKSNYSFFHGSLGRRLWIRDRSLELNNGNQLVSSISGNHKNLVEHIFSELGISFLDPNIAFETGNILGDDNHVYIGKNDIIRAAYIRTITQKGFSSEQIKSLCDAIQRFTVQENCLMNLINDDQNTFGNEVRNILEELHKLFGKELIVLGWIPGEFEALLSGKADKLVSQQNFHIDMIMCPIGNGRVIVAQDTSSKNKRMEQDQITRELEAHGLTVTRTPQIEYLSYTNSLIETPESGSQRGYIPQYTERNPSVEMPHPNLLIQAQHEKANDNARNLYEKLGIRTYPVPILDKITTDLHGSLRCMTLDIRT